MKNFAILIVLVLALISAGCSKDENQPSPASPAAKTEEQPKVMKQAEQAAQQAQEKVAAVAEQAKEQATQIKEEAGEKVAQVTEQAKEQMAKAEQKVQTALPMETSDISAGEAIYTKNCSVCHKLGVAGAPKTGDKTAWAPRIAEGKDKLVAHAISGMGAMPARGGNSKLTDENVRAAVEYMIEQSR